MKITNAKIFLFSLLAFILAVLMASFLPINFLKQEIIFFVIFFCFLILAFVSHKKRKIFIASIIGAFFILGFWRYSLSLPKTNENKIWFYNEKKIEFLGSVISLPTKSNNSKKIRFEAKKVFINGKEREVKGNVLVTFNNFLNLSYGDELILYCELKTPEKIENFLYDRYLAKQNIFSLCYYPVILSQGPGQKNLGKILYRPFIYIRTKFSEIIDKGCHRPISDILKAVILGDKSGLGDDIKMYFSLTGLSHIIAISGMHISIIASTLMSFFLLLGFWRKQAFYFSSFVLCMYIIVIGIPPSALRAGVMGFLMLWAINLGRLNQVTNSIVFSCFCMLFMNPRLLRDDIGFQLSFLAVIGIVLFFPIFESIFCFKNKYLKLAFDIVFVTLSAQVLTLPIIALNFKTISFISLLANLLVLWVLPFILIFSFLAIFLSLFFPFLNFMFFSPSIFLVNYIIYVAKNLSIVPFAFFQIEQINFLLIFFYYLFVLFFLLWKKKSRGLKE